MRIERKSIKKPTAALLLKHENNLETSFKISSKLKIKLSLFFQSNFESTILNLVKRTVVKILHFADLTVIFIERLDSDMRRTDNQIIFALKKLN